MKKSPALPTELDGGPFAVATHALSKAFPGGWFDAGRQALHEVSLRVPEGAVYLLVGPNGAGKSTLLRSLLDLVRPSGGWAEVCGLGTDREGPRVRAQIGYVPEKQDWGYAWMRVDRLLRHHAAFFPSWDQAYAERLASSFEIRLDARYGKLSKGEARRVQLLMALAHRPPVLLLDEPTDGLDPVMRDELTGLLAEQLAETPTTVLISSHLVHESEALADHVGVLRDGTLRTQLPLSELRRRLLRYRADAPEGWAGVSTLNGSVLRRRQSGRDAEWIVWGDEREVVQHFTSSGATVREASPLSLEEATVALLSRKD